MSLLPNPRKLWDQNRSMSSVLLLVVLIALFEITSGCGTPNLNAGPQDNHLTSNAAGIMVVPASLEAPSQTTLANYHIGRVPPKPDAAPEHHLLTLALVAGVTHGAQSVLALAFLTQPAYSRIRAPATRDGLGLRGTTRDVTGRCGNRPKAANAAPQLESVVAGEIASHGDPLGWGSNPVGEASLDFSVDRRRRPPPLAF